MRNPNRSSPPHVPLAISKRITGLDGVRGLAALFVVMNHIFERAFPGYPVDRAPFWAAPFIYGRFAVVVFIVLSGFSLALSPARHGWRLDGVRRFAQRRARRILAPYWAALAFSLAVAWLVVPAPGQGPPDAQSVVVNGLLVQNLVGAPTPNRAFWSMAVEAQLYVVFPLLLLLVRRWSAVVMVATVTLLVATVGILSPHVALLHVFVIQSAPDLAALFALGVLSAGIVRASSARKSWPWAWLALVAAAPALATIWWRGSVWTLDHLLWVDLALGPAVACLLAGLATGRPAPLLRMLDARPLRSLGSCSYSLYLTHAPIVVVVYDRIVAGRVRQGVPAFLVTVALAVPLTIVFARAFASVFETRLRRARLPVPVVLDAVCVPEQSSLAIGDVDQDRVLVRIEGAHRAVGRGGEDDQPGRLPAVVAEPMGTGRTLREAADVAGAQPGLAVGVP